MLRRGRKLGRLSPKSRSPKSREFFARANVGLVRLAVLLIAAIYCAATPAERELGGLSGVVVDQRGSPIEGATVELWREGESLPHKEIQTAADGVFRFQSIA